MPNKENVEIFESLFTNYIDRDGADRLLEFIRKSDFYTAPASTRFHLSEEGGLLTHSLHVAECLINKLSSPTWYPVLKNTSIETVFIVSLLHDLCKTYMYDQDYKNQKTYDPVKVGAAYRSQVKHDAKGEFIWETIPAYTINNRYPLGHGSKSVFFILQFMRLTMEEIACINWHMGAYCDKDQWGELGQAYEKYPLAMALHEADMEATHLLEV